MAESDGIRDRLMILFRDGLHVDVPSSSTELINESLLDSVTFVELLLRIEQDFGIAISLDELELDHFSTIDSIAAYLVARRPS